MRKQINKNNSTIDGIKPEIVAEVIKRRTQEKQKGHHGLYETFQSNKRKRGGGKRATFT